LDVVRDRVDHVGGPEAGGGGRGGPFHAQREALAGGRADQIHRLASDLQCVANERERE